MAGQTDNQNRCTSTMWHTASGTNMYKVMN